MEKNASQSSQILVTGGAGYIGSVLVKKLLDEGHKVKIFDKFYFGDVPLKHIVSSKNLEMVIGNICQPPANLFKNVSTVIHLAGLSNDPTAEFNPKANFEINTLASITLAKKAKIAKVKRFIFASSCSVYNTEIENDQSTKDENESVYPKAPYPASKVAAEKGILKLHDETFTVIILRKGTVYGFSPRMRYDLIINTMIKDALKHGALKVFGGGKQWRPLVSVSDVADAYLLSLSAPTVSAGGQIINIACGNFMVDNVAQQIQSLFKKFFSRNITISYENRSRPDRSYCVNLKKSRTFLKFYPKQNIEAAVKELFTKISQSRMLQDFDNPIFYNIRWMKPLLSDFKDKSQK